MRKFLIAPVLALALSATAPLAWANSQPAMAPATQVQALNLNTADADMLRQGLVGIGQAKAEAIVAHRQANGAFTSVDELLEVRGIGKALLDRNRDRLAVN